jgi:DNA-binding HxlR family transcriptional regulator
MILMDRTNKRFKYSWGIDATLAVIGGKWKPLVIYELKGGTLRFSQLLAVIKPRITQRMLTKELRSLEKSGIVTRKVYPQVPPKVEYSLTKTGKSIIPILDDLCVWGYKHLDKEIEFKC